MQWKEHEVENLETFYLPESEVSSPVKWRVKLALGSQRSLTCQPDPSSDLSSQQSPDKYVKGQNDPAMPSEVGTFRILPREQHRHGFFHFWDRDITTPFGCFPACFHSISVRKGTSPLTPRMGVQLVSGPDTKRSAEGPKCHIPGGALSPPTLSILPASLATGMGFQEGASGQIYCCCFSPGDGKAQEARKEVLHSHTTSSVSGGLSWVGTWLE